MGLRAYRAVIFDRIRASLWAIPIALILLAIGLAVAAVLLDRTVQWGTDDRWWGIAAGPSGTRETLTTVGGSVMTVAGVSFSMTVVVLQLASSQYSPRVVRSFRRDRVIQVVFGAYVATFVYTLLVLRTVTSSEYGSIFTAPISVSIAVVLGIACMILLVVLIHHVAQIVQVSSIVRAIEHETDEVMERLYPEMLGERERSPAESPRPERSDEPFVICAGRSGFLAHVDERAIEGIEGAELVVIEPCVGDYVGDTAVLARVWPRAAGERSSEPRDAFVVEPERTMPQDVRYGIRLLADIALRALSPSLNDPTTARHCVEVMGAILSRLVRRCSPDPLRRTKGGLVVYAARPSFEEVLRLAFEEIIDAAERQPGVELGVASALAGIAALDRSGAHGPGLRRLCARIARVAARAGWDPEDVERVRRALDGVALRA